MSNEITVSGRKSITNGAVHRAIVDNSWSDLWTSCGQLGSREFLAKKNEEKEAEGAFPTHQHPKSTLSPIVFDLSPILHSEQSDPPCANASRTRLTGLRSAFVALQREG